jgi:hypothetical protein
MTNSACAECGMVVTAGEYHPYAARQLFKSMCPHLQRVLSVVEAHASLQKPCSRTLHVHGGEGSLLPLVLPRGPRPAHAYAPSEAPNPHAMGGRSLARPATPWHHIR